MPTIDRRQGRLRHPKTNGNFAATVIRGRTLSTAFHKYGVVFTATVPALVGATRGRPGQMPFGPTACRSLLRERAAGLVRHASRLSMAGRVAHHTGRLPKTGMIVMHSTLRLYESALRMGKGGYPVAPIGFNLEGKVALVTGGNDGIGLGIAEALAQAGSDVCIWGRNDLRNAAAKEKLSSSGKRVLALQCDVSDEKQVEECFAATVRILGRVDSCFANAGVLGDGTKFHEMSLNQWRQMFTVNIDGAFLTLRAAIRHMVERGEGGSLVAISSISANLGMPRREHYAATKAGLVAVVRGIAVEYARHGIRANAVLPGWVQTRMTEDLMGWKRFEDAVKPRIPAGRWGSPSDYGAIAVYFASDASAFHTGDAVVIDGGYSCF